MSVTGEPRGEPAKAGVALLDVVTGLQAAIGVLAALARARRHRPRPARERLALRRERRRHGEPGGEHLDRRRGARSRPGHRAPEHRAVPGVPRARTGRSSSPAGTTGSSARTCEVVGHPDVGRRPSVRHEPGSCRATRRAGIPARGTRSRRRPMRRMARARSRPASVPCSPIRRWTRCSPRPRAPRSSSESTTPCAGCCAWSRARSGSTARRLARRAPPPRARRRHRRRAATGPRERSRRMTAAGSLARATRVRGRSPEASSRTQPGVAVRASRPSCSSSSTAVGRGGAGSRADAHHPRARWRRCPKAAPCSTSGSAAARRPCRWRARTGPSWRSTARPTCSRGSLANAAADAGPSRSRGVTGRGRTRPPRPSRPTSSSRPRPVQRRRDRRLRDRALERTLAAASSSSSPRSTRCLDARPVARASTTLERPDAADGGRCRVALCEGPRVRGGARGTRGGRGARQAAASSAAGTRSIVRRRLCLPADRDAEIADALGDPAPGVRRRVGGSGPRGADRRHALVGLEADGRRPRARSDGGEHHGADGSHTCPDPVDASRDRVGRASLAGLRRKRTCGTV